MKVTAPSFGLLFIPLHFLFNSLGIEYIQPSVRSKKNWDKALSVSPEQICLPFKYNISNYFDSIDKGVDTIFIAGGHGPCRFGLYGFLQSKIIKMTKPDFNFIVINQDNIIEFINVLIKVSPKNLNKIKLFIILLKSLRILKLAEKNMELYLGKKYQEKNPGETKRIYDIYEKILLNLKSTSRLKEISKKMDLAYKGIETKKQTEINIGILGEIYMVIEKNANMDLREKLACAHVKSDQVIHISEWIMILLKLDFLNRISNSKIKKMASKYIKNEVGGKGLYSIASAINYAEKSYDGIIHLTPFGCMPEIVAQSILKKISKDYSIPILFLNFDEHSGEAGLDTRIEAFVDMLSMKKEKNETLSGN